jgi:hypothetical protein
VGSTPVGVGTEIGSDVADGATVAAWLEALGALLETGARDVDVDADMLLGEAKRLVSPVVVRAQGAAA